MDRARYWKNVLNYNKQQISVLVLEDLSDGDISFIEDNKLVRFLLVDQSSGLNLNNVLYIREGYLPDDLKNINYCLYRGEEKNKIFPVLSSGISVIRDFSEIGEQTSLDRINNFELAASVI